MKHVDTLTLHRYRYGELDRDEVEDLRSHLDGCAACRERLAAQQNNRAAFELEPVPEALRSRTRARTRRRWWLGLGLPVLAAAAALLVVPLVMPPGGETPEVVRRKAGESSLEAWIQDGDGGRPLGPDEAVQAGDRLQLRYLARDHRRVTLAGRDGTGAVELYGTWRVADEGGWQLAPASLVLDDSPGPQAFYAVFSDQEPDPERVRRAISTGAPERGMEIVGIVLEKD